MSVKCLFPLLCGRILFSLVTNEKTLTFREEYEDLGGLEEARIVVEGESEVWKRNMGGGAINELLASQFYLYIHCWGKKDVVKKMKVNLSFRWSEAEPSIA